MMYKDNKAFVRLSMLLVFMFFLKIVLLVHDALMYSEIIRRFK